MQTFFKIESLPEDYIVRKFYEYGFYVTYHKGNNSYNCACPMCMEGNSFGKKKRCWYLPKLNIIHCFNCGRSFSPYNWISKVGDLSFKDIATEIENGEYNIVNIDKKKIEESYVPKNNFVSYNLLGLPEDCIDLTDKIEMDYYKSNSIVMKAMRYIKGRRLNTAVNKPTKLYLSLKDYTHKNRIIFPFFDSKKFVPFFQSRAFGGNVDGFREEVRYLSKSGSEKSIFNYDKISDEIEDIYVFEGPIDACFCRNGVAVAGITESGGVDLTSKQKSQLSFYELTHRVVWMLDSQYLDDTARSKTEKLLKMGECVFIWPEEQGRKYKDFNEWCIEEKIDEVPLEIIRENIRCSYSDMLMIKFRKDWSLSDQSLEEDFYGDYKPGN